MSYQQEEPKEKQVVKQHFFQKVWNAITKIERYPEMAAQGGARAFSYLCKLIVILAMVLSLGMVYQIHQMVQQGVDYLQKDFPDFHYQEGILEVNTQDPIRITGDEAIVQKAIIDTKTEDETTVNQYINEIIEAGSGVIILKDKVILKNFAVAGTINYQYKEMTEQMKIGNFTKQDVIHYANSSQMISVYISIFLMVFIYAFTMYLLNTLLNVLLLGLFGYLASWFARLKIRFVALLNMSIYALTLSILLNAIYVGVNVFIDFNMEYFQVMYLAVATIYLIAAIFLLKDDFIKKQQELIQIMQERAQRTPKEEDGIEPQEKPEKKEENKGTKKEGNAEETPKKEKEEKGNDGEVGEPEGSNI